jgi:WD40 repeat protein
VSFSPDGKRVALGGADNTVRIYRAETWDAERVFETSSPYIRDIGWTPAGDRLAAVTDEGLHVYELPSGKEIRFVRVRAPRTPGGTPGSGADPPEFLWSPGGDRLALSGFDNAVVRVFAGVALEEEVVLKGHYRAVTSMTWDTVGRLYTGSWDGTVRRWDVASGKWEFLTPNLGPGSIRLAMLDSIGALATMAYGDKAVLAWDIRSGKLQKKAMSSTPLVLFRPSRDSRMMALATTERSIWIRGIPGWDTSRVLTAEGTVEECRWSPDGRYLAGRAAGDAAVTVWDVATGGAVRLRVREEEMISMDWSPDGRRLVTGSRTGKIREWTLAN